MMSTIETGLVLDDTLAMLGFLDAQATVMPGRIGAVGYCMSGAFATAAAARYPDRFCAVASLHGTRLVTDQPDSPHMLLSRISAELYYGFGEADPLVPMEVVDTFRSALARTATVFEVDVFPRAEHGFSFTENSRTFEPLAAAVSWQRILGLLHRTLRSQTVLKSAN